MFLFSNWSRSVHVLLVFFALTGFVARCVEIVSVSLDGPAILRCQLDFPGGLVRPYTVHWFKQGQEAPIFLWQDGKPPRMPDEYKGRLGLAGSASLTISQIQEDDLGLYECRIYVHIDDNSIQNTTWILLDLEDHGLHFVEEPKSVLLLPGQTDTLKCSSSPTTNIRWRFNGQFIQHEHPNIEVKGNQLKISVENELKSGDSSVAGFYQCVANLGNLALTSRPGKISVAVLDAFTAGNVTVSATIGEDVIIPCNPPRSIPAGILRLRYSSGSLIELSDRIKLLPNGKFKIQSIQQNDATSYKCSLENPALLKEETSQGIIHLVILPSDNRQPQPAKLTIVPESQLAVPHRSNLSLFCGAIGVPSPTIKWTKYGGNLTENSGELTLFRVGRNDIGTYVCEANNSIGDPVSTFTVVEILEPATINQPLLNQTAEEGSEVTFECESLGTPQPVNFWVHNGVDLKSSEDIAIRDRKLVIRSVSLSSAGFYQCFAVNDLGTDSSTARLHVFPHLRDVSHPTEATDEDELNRRLNPHNPSNEPTDADNFLEENHNKRRPHHKKNKKTNPGTNPGENLMVPPTRPHVTKLSDESVMVRWDVPDNNGLAIQFFKVQYKDVSRSTSRWMTIDDEIPAHINSFEVSNLKLGHTYRFRIAAVYSNNDNNQGPVSSKFLLQKDPKMKKPVIGPAIVHSEAVSASAILLRWQYIDVDLVPVEGFFIYYRATTTAAYYSKATVMGSHSRVHILSHLLPDTIYEIKMQCFNVAGTSDFSNISTQKTLKSEVQATGVQETHTNHVVPVASQSNKDTMYMAMLGAVLGMVILILIASMIYCNWKQRQQRRELLATLGKTLRGDYQDANCTTEVELSALSSPGSTTKRETVNGRAGRENGTHHVIAKDAEETAFSDEYLNNNLRQDMTPVIDLEEHSATDTDS